MQQKSCLRDSILTNALYVTGCFNLAVSIEDVLKRNPKTMTDDEILQSEKLLREEADYLLLKIFNTVPANESDELEDIYEAAVLRNGSPYAQWLMEQIAIADRQTIRRVAVN